MHYGKSIPCWPKNAEAAEEHDCQFADFFRRLARNTGKLDSIIAGLEKMTGGGAAAQKITYDCGRRKIWDRPARPSRDNWGIPEADRVAMLETQRMLFSPAKDVPGFAEFLWPTPFRSCCRPG